MPCVGPVDPLDWFDLRDPHPSSQDLLLGFFRILFSTYFLMSLGNPKKVCYFGPRGLLEPSYIFSVPNLTPKSLPKSMFFGLQEVTYVGRRKNLKIWSPPRRKPHFYLPRAPQNRPKIDEKSIPRDPSFHVHFQHPFKSPPGALPGHLMTIFKHKVKF